MINYKLEITNLGAIVRLLRTPIRDEKSVLD